MSHSSEAYINFLNANPNPVTGCGIKPIPGLTPPSGACWSPIPGHACRIALWGFVHNDGRHDTYFALDGEGLACRGGER